MIAATKSHALNAQAVELIQEGNFEKAILVLRAALNNLAAGSILRSQSQPPEKISVSTNNWKGDLLLIRSVPSLKHTFTCQDHHTVTMFDRALYMEATTDPDIISSSALGQNTIAAILLYNVGLVHQLQGIQNPSKQRDNFENAMEAYQRAAAILENTFTTENVVVGLVNLSIRNNMGHIYSHFCEGRKAQWCLDWLRFILEVSPASEGGFSQDFLIFHMNVVTLHGKQDAVAAAA
jgi:tetratricopeptide (TPR) repeat protein